MPVVQKIVSIDVQSNISKFTEEFDRYNEVLSKQPELWADVAKENKAMADGFKVMTALMLAQVGLAEKTASETKKLATSSGSAAFSWDSMTRSSKSFFNNVVGATRQLEKWTGIFTLASGLTIGGSLFGFERLAAGAGAGRREATGLGLSYGAKRAFDVTYGRFVESDTLLHGVSTARGDPTSAEARAMFALGMVPGQSGDTAEASQETLRRVRALAQRTPDSMLGTVTKAYGLDALGYSVESMRRLKGASDADLDEQGYKKRIQDFGVSDKALKDMQEFDMALESAGIKIKSTFIELLGPLAPQLKMITEGMSDAIRQLLGSQGFKDGIEWAAKGLHEFGEYVNTPAFKQDIRDLADGISYAAKKMVEWARFLGLLPQSAEEKAKNAAIADQTHGSMKNEHNATSSSFGKGGKVNPLNPSNGGTKYLPDGTPISDTPPQGMSAGNGELSGNLSDAKGPGHNLFGMRPIGASTGFQSYNTNEESVISASNNLLAYDRAGWKSIREIISHWAPSSENDTQAYINKMAQRTGYDPDKQLDLQDPTVRATVLAGIAKQEQGNSISPGQLKVVIENNTGGSAVTSVATAGGVSGIGTPGPSILQ